ncbi:hypothetical protein J6590_001580 [Homalodisca vitripennis]|nr:hypothetical protein J6590_001580 [Homalodisca vitripennis]
MGWIILSTPPELLLLPSLRGVSWRVKYLGVILDRVLNWDPHLGRVGLEDLAETFVKAVCLRGRHALIFGTVVWWPKTDTKMAVACAGRSSGLLPKPHPLVIIIWTMARRRNYLQQAGLQENAEHVLLDFSSDVWPGWYEVTLDYHSASSNDVWMAQYEVPLDYQSASNNDDCRCNIRCHLTNNQQKSAMFSRDDMRLTLDYHLARTNDVSGAYEVPFDYQSATNSDVSSAI